MISIVALASGSISFVIYVVAGAIFFVLVWALRRGYTNRYRAKQASGAAVVEVPHDFVVADGCPNCGDEKAHFAVKVRKRIIAGSRGEHLAAFLHPWTFRYCLRCVRLVRRKRRAGAILFVAGVVPLAIWIAFIFGVMQSERVELLWRETILDRFGGWSVPIFFIPLVLGLFLCIFGAYLGEGQRGVDIVDTGSGTLFLEFGSDRYRTTFARLNAVEGWSGIDLSAVDKQQAAMSAVRPPEVNSPEL